MSHDSSFHREQFQAMIESVFCATGSPAKHWKSYRNEDGLSADQLCGQVWQCTDILPRDFCEVIDIPSGSTYAQAARSLRKWGAAHV